MKETPIPSIQFMGMTVGFPFDIFNKQYAMRPMNNAKPEGLMKLILSSRGRAVIEREADLKDLIHSVLLESTEGRFPEMESNGFNFGTAANTTGNQVSSKLAKQISNHPNKKEAQNALALHCGGFDSMASVRLSRSNDVFWDLWQGKMLRRLEDALCDVAENMEGQCQLTEPFIASFHSTLKARKLPVVTAFLMHTGLDERVVNIAQLACIVGRERKEHADMCFEALWLAGYLLNSPMLFMLGLRYIDYTVDPVKYPYIHCEVIDNYNEFLASKTHSGFTYLQAIVDGAACINTIHKTLVNVSPSLDDVFQTLIQFSEIAESIDSESIEIKSYVNRFVDNQGRLAQLVQQLEPSDDAGTPNGDFAFLTSDEIKAIRKAHKILSPISAKQIEQAIAYTDDTILEADFDGEDDDLRVDLSCLSGILNTFMHHIEHRQGLKRDYALLHDELSALMASSDVSCDDAFERITEKRAQLKAAQSDFDTALSHSIEETELLGDITDTITSVIAAAIESQSKSANDAEPQNDVDTAKQLKALEDELQKMRNERKRLKGTVMHLESKLTKHEAQANKPQNDHGFKMYDVLTGKTPLERALKLAIIESGVEVHASPATLKSVAQNKCFARIDVFFNKMSVLLSRQFMDDYTATGSQGAFKYFTKTELAFNESETTMATKPQTRKFTFDDGVERTCVNHIRIGVDGTEQNMLRIYFTIEDGKVFIGDITKHLPVSNHG